MVEILPNGVFYKTYYPFKTFSKDQSPDWWNAYNKVKHKWYDKLKVYGTLKNVIEALGGLFILNVLKQYYGKNVIMKLISIGWYYPSLCY